MESALTMTPFSRSAISSASTDLPLAVGPAIRIAPLTIPSPESVSLLFMTLVATLVSNPKVRALSADLAHKAAQVVGASKTTWLADGVACDLELPARTSMPETEAALREVLALEPVDIVIQQAAT